MKCFFPSFVSGTKQIAPHCPGGSVRTWDRHRPVRGWARVLQCLDEIVGALAVRELENPEVMDSRPRVVQMNLDYTGRNIRNRIELVIAGGNSDDRRSRRLELT